MARLYVVIFVEGETEKEFYEVLIKYYRKHSSNKLTQHKIINIKGIGRFESKMSLKLQNEILTKHNEKNVHVICCHDTDVFDLGKKPPIDWNAVSSKVEKLGVPIFKQIQAKGMIEDWFLADICGICSFLNIKEVKKADGKDGNDKIMKLFKKGGKLYIKGARTEKFITSLYMAIIRSYAQEDLKALENALHVNMQEKIKKKKN